MQISIVGDSTKLSKEEIRSAVKFFAKKLMQARLIKQLRIKIIFLNLGRNHPGAECEWMDNNIKPREFEVSVHNRYGRRSQLLSLAHELVHIKQFAKGEMVDLLKTQRVRFHNKQYNYTKISYWEQPWEIEAYGRELGLYEMYKQDLKNQKDKII